MSEKLLIVEDDKKINDGICLALKNDAYFFYQCRTLQEAREILKKEDITLVLLDVNLPDGNGIDFVREIRKNSQVPIILLTVNNMEVDIVTGLEAGANDYITKPFSLMDLSSISIKWNFSKMENLLNLVRQNKSSLECCVKTEEKLFHLKNCLKMFGVRNSLIIIILLWLISGD